MEVKQAILTTTVSRVSGRPVGWQAYQRSSILIRLLLAAGVCAIAAALSVRFDHLWSSYLTLDRLPGDLRKAVNLSEAFAHGLGAAAILGATLMVSARRRGALWVAVLITATSGLVANGLKGCIVRVRPHAEASIEVSGHESDRGGETGNAAPEVVSADFWDSRQRSFPSGHAATAWGLMIGLSLAFPRGALIFALFATLASLQRIVSGAHFPSDVLAGGAIACACASVILSIPKFRRAVGFVLKGD